MIGIQMANGEFLELPSEMQYAFDQTNPAFQEDFESGDHVFPIDIPAVGKNESLLDIPAKINNFSRVLNYDIIIWLGGSRWKPGRLKIDRPGTQQHSAYILTGVRSFDSLDKKLYEIPMGGDHVFGNTSDDIVDEANAAVLKDITTTEYNFPTIRNEAFYGDTNPDWEYFINRWDVATASFRKNEFGGPGDPVNKDSLVPMVYMFHILKYVFLNEGFLLVDQSNNTDLKLDVVYNNRPLDSRSDYGLRAGLSAAQTGTWPTPGTVVEFDDISTAPNHDTLGGFNISLHNWAVTAAGIFRIRCSVFVKITSIIGYVNKLTFRVALGSNGNFGVMSKLNYDPVERVVKGFQVGEIVRVDFDRIYLLDASYIGQTLIVFPLELNGVVGGGNGINYEFQTTSFLEITDLSQSTKNVYSNIINLQNHMPDVTVKDLLKFCMMHYNIQFDFDVINRNYFIKTKKVIPLPDAADIDITKRAEPNHEIEVGEDTIKSIGFNWPGDDDMLNENFIAYDKQNDIGAFNTFADFPTPVKEGLTALDLETNIRYIVGLDLSSALEWQHFTDGFYDLVLNKEGNKELKDDITPLMMRRFTSVITGDVVCPQIEQESDNSLMGVTNDRISSIRVVKYYGFGTPDIVITDNTFQDMATNWVEAGGTTWNQATWGPGPTLGAYCLSGTEGYLQPNPGVTVVTGKLYRISYKLFDIAIASTIRFDLNGTSSATINLPVTVGEFTGYVDIIAGAGSFAGFEIWGMGDYFLTEVTIPSIIPEVDYPRASSMSSLVVSAFAGSRCMWNDPTFDSLINTAGDNNLYLNYIDWIRFMNAKEVFIKNINFDINDVIRMFQYGSGITYQRRIEGANIVFKKLSYTVDQKVQPTRGEFILIPWN